MILARPDCGLEPEGQNYQPGLNQKGLTRRPLLLGKLILLKLPFEIPT